MHAPASADVEAELSVKPGLCSIQVFVKAWLGGDLMTVNFTIICQQLEMKVCPKLLMNARKIKGLMIDPREIPLDTRMGLKRQLQGIDLVSIFRQGS